MSATGFPFNMQDGAVYLLGPLDATSEIGLQNLKEMLNKITVECSENDKSAKWSNLNHEEKEE